MNIGVDVVMSISQVEETITVTAETPMLEIARPGNILTIEGEFQRDLPIQARGNWSDFLRGAQRLGIVVIRTGKSVQTMVSTSHPRTGI